jgi:WXXGXW repeat (2 copies)
MSKPLSALSFSARPLARVALYTAVGVLAAGCTVAVRPLPPPAYVAPPPPPVAYVAPAPVVEGQIYEAPPPLPVYEQPPCPVVGYMWTPGYWGYAPTGYYWVPGTWVAPPRVGLLWTPGYWGYAGGVYAFHAGYWGPHIGFYGGVNYGFGYVGTGYAGGRWVGNSFAYNAAVTNVNVTVVHNTYNETVVNNVTVNRVSFNGGSGGVVAAPTAQERVAAQEPHVQPTAQQQQHVTEAAKNPALFAKANGGHPAIAATTHPATFTGPGVVGAKYAGHPAGTAPMTPGAHPPGGVKPAVANNGAKPPKPPKQPVQHKERPEHPEGERS